jgi:hypothetical protein
MLGPLQNNGGPTFTHELLTGSPAIDAGDPSFTPPPNYDQRGPGFNRVVNGRIDIGAFEVPPCQLATSIRSNFNGTAINAGNYIWFTSVLKPSGLPTNQPVTIHFTNQSITSSAFTLPVPNATVVFDPAATMASTTFAGGMPVTTVPSFGLKGNTFFSALSYLVPANIPGRLNPVTWSGTISSDTPGVSIVWKWAAAVYTSFSSDYNALGVKPVDDKNASIYQNADKAGTPENFKPFVIGGARGGGGANYTGGYSGSGAVRCPL